MNEKDFMKKLSNHTPVILGSENHAKFAVLLPLIKKEDGIHVLFEERSYTLKQQPGDICFPGGKVDAADSSFEETAIRETVEELGIKRENIGELYPLDYLVSPFGNIIYPYAGFIHSLEELNINKAEVESIFTVPLEFFVKNPPKEFHVQFNAELSDNFPLKDIVGGKDYKWRPLVIPENFYYYEDRVIWGLTAGIVKQFINKFVK